MQDILRRLMEQRMGLTEAKKAKDKEKEKKAKDKEKEKKAKEEEEKKAKEKKEEEERTKEGEEKAKADEEKKAKEEGKNSGEKPENSDEKPENSDKESEAEKKDEESTDKPADKPFDAILKTVDDQSITAVVSTLASGLNSVIGKMNAGGKDGSASTYKKAKEILDQCVQDLEALKAGSGKDVTPPPVNNNTGESTSAGEEDPNNPKT